MHFLRLLSHFAMHEHSVKPMQDAFLPRRPCQEAEKAYFNRSIDIFGPFEEILLGFIGFLQAAGLHHGDWHHGLHPGGQHEGDRVQ